jgi:hypothetical protein
MFPKLQISRRVLLQLIMISTMKKRGGKIIQWNTLLRMKSILIMLGRHSNRKVSLRKKKKKKRRRSMMRRRKKTLKTKIN